MKCSEFQELAAGFALDALSEEERFACQRHLRDEGPHDGCEALLARYRGATLALGELVPHRPLSPRVWRAIEARLGFEANIETRPMATLPRTRPRDGGRLREGLAWATAAAALIAALWSVETARTARRAHQAEQVRAEQALTQASEQLGEARSARDQAHAARDQASVAREECSAALAQLTERGLLARDAVSLLEHPATRLAPMKPVAAQPYRATALYNPETKQAAVISSTITPVADKDYELWVIARGDPTPQPAGFLRFDASGVAIGSFDAARLADVRPVAFAISLEPLGGGPTPTDIVLTAKL